jgi:CubicO group peptidase (beta-lactamase class C family)
MEVGAQVAAVGAASRIFVFDHLAQAADGKYAATVGPLDQFVAKYMREMNAPGMTFVMADRDGVHRVATYGFGDTELKVGIRPEEIFHIGSISKSFTAVCLLQLRDEGKLDVHKPIFDYLPWFRVESNFAPITVHHLLTHSAGLPDDPPVFLSDPAEKHRAAYAPGEHFHYCNMGYATLGHLLETLDGRELPESIRKRIFEPLGMSQSEPVITLDYRERMAKSYSVFKGDRPYSRDGRLCEAAAIVETLGSGCVAATAGDMGRYVQMIANRGKGPNGRILSEESFALFSKPHIKADEFGPTASYGYGIAVDTLDGHTILRHTGGMVSFASSIQVDIDQGVGAFASINAMQGYRPQPVTQYAFQLMRAVEESKGLPALPEMPPAYEVKNASDYAGIYHDANGGKLEFAAADGRLFLVMDGERVPLQRTGGDNFTRLHANEDRFALVFGRADAKDPKSAVVEVGWGEKWYTNANYSGPKTFEYPKEWNAFAGHYRNESAWIGSMRVVLRKGTLMVDGVTPLASKGGDVFFLRDDENSPEWIRFCDVVNGRAMRIKFSGDDLWRVAAK